MRVLPHTHTQGPNAVFSLRLDDVSKVFVVEPKQVVGSSQVSIRVANGTLDYENPNQRKFIVLVSVAAGRLGGGARALHLIFGCENTLIRLECIYTYMNNECMRVFVLGVI